ncbi:histidinol phosphate aminotransferase [Alisedimentitalea sp. MJ-SS2]|uniref:histidinol phosphate aminotransferase n=1 Tax=Aliisedimentitalea sp. MJ-SS2 TaxID=3049795 RepID=UPI00290D3972|nr:histidinol phosphate aminotransferase [Alisedimentitalea sp. MJ-SS2]MDU8928408.1 histidinol phosphate aminotransferase [Alisedimentitalea sp. MJ-SS2]
MRSHPRLSVSNYETATLVMGFVNLLWVFMVVWATMGFSALLILAVFLDYLITRLDHYLARRDT